MNPTPGPFAPPPPRRNVFLQIPLSREEKSIIAAAASRSGVSQSELVRSAVAEQLRSASDQIHVELDAA